MTATNPFLYVIIAILALVAIGTTVAYINEQQKAPGVEIRLDRNGLKIEGN